MAGRPGPVGAHAPHEGAVAPGGLERAGHVVVGDAGGRPQQLAGALGADRAGELRRHAHAVAGEDGDAHAGARDEQVRDLKDLARLVAQLLLLVGLPRAVAGIVPGPGHGVEGDGVDVHARIREVHGPPVQGQGLHVLGDGGPHLPGELGHPGAAGAGDRLVGRGDEPDEPGLLVQRLEGGHDRHGGAVGVGDDALGPLAQGVGVDLGDHEGNVGIPPPGRGVVDDDGAGGRELRRVLARGRPAGGEDGDVDAVRVGGGEVLDLDPGAAELQHRPGGAGRGEEPHGAGGEAALLEQGAHDAAHLAGGAHDGHRDAVGGADVLVDGPAAGPGVAHRPVPP